MLVYCEALPMKIILKVPTTFAFLYKTHLIFGFNENDNV